MCTSCLPLGFSFVLLSPVYPVPDSFVTVVSYAGVDIADEHEPKCDLDFLGEQIDCYEVHYENRNSIGDGFGQRPSPILFGNRASRSSFVITRAAGFDSSVYRYS